MASFNQNANKHKATLLSMAAEPGNVSKACKLTGFSKDTFYRFMLSAKSSSPFWVFIVLSISVLYPRLMLLGGFPQMDEGLFVWLTELCHESLQNHAPLPIMHGLPLESAILSWVYYLPGFPILWLRGCDMLLAFVAGWLLCRIYQHECGSRAWGLVLALIFLCPMNYAAVIDSGYKNPIPIAFCFLFAAMRMLQSGSLTKSPRCFLAGICTGLAVFFREPFFIFALIGLVAVWRYGGFASAVRYTLGGLATIAVFFMILAILQGGMAGIWEVADSYLGRAAVYAQESHRIKDNFFSALYEALRFFKGPFMASMVLAAIFTFTAWSGKKRSRLSGGRAMFWLAVTLLPLLEPLTKIGFLYHLAVCLPGLGGLCAFFFAASRSAIHNLSHRSPAYWRFGAITLALTCCLVSIMGLPKISEGKMSAAMLRNFPQHGWPKEYSNQSNALLAADIIREHLPPGGTLATSGFSFFLFGASDARGPKTGYFDPDDKYRLNDMGRSWLLMKGDNARFAAALRANPPDVLAVGKANSTHEKDYADEIRTEVEKSGLYRLLGIVPFDKKRKHGWMEYFIYARKQASF